jgi:hypothetical protein
MMMMMSMVVEHYNQKEKFYDPCGYMFTANCSGRNCLHDNDIFNGNLLSIEKHLDFCLICTHIYTQCTVDDDDAKLSGGAAVGQKQ